MRKINIGKITQNIPAVKCFPDAPNIVFLHLNMKKTDTCSLHPGFRHRAGDQNCRTDEPGR